MTDRRQFLRRLVALALAAKFAGAAAAEKKAAAKLRLLVIGAGFAGANIAERARHRGHDVTVVQRVTRADTQKLKLDARTELPVEGRQWDAVIDTTAHVPMEVELLAPLLRAHAQQYLLLSSTAVYAKLPAPGAGEDTPLATTTDRNLRQVTNERASALLVLCEKAAAKLLPDHVAIIRAGLLFGPGDPSGRSSYWPMRVARGGTVLAPGKPDDPVQIIDVRDAADFVVRCAERRTAGTFNADGAPTTIGALLEACRKAAQTDARFVWVDAQFIANHHVAAYRDLPVWAPAAGEFSGFGRISSAKARALGLQWRPLGQTVADTLAWARSAPEAREALPRAGLDDKRESGLLKVWRMEQAPAPAKAPPVKRRNARPAGS